MVGRADDGAAASDVATIALTYEEAYRRMGRSLTRLAFLLSGSAAVAEDVVHDVFVRAGRRWERIDDPAPYLRRAVVNACRDAARASRRRRDREDRAARLGDAPAMASSDHADRLEAWHDALLALPARHRAVIVLRYVDDLDDARIAALLGCREATVRSCAHRALTRLREVATDVR